MRGLESDPGDTIFETFFDGFKSAGKDCGVKPNVLTALFWPEFIAAT